jgi:hypothetical protein
MNAEQDSGKRDSVRAALLGSEPMRAERLNQLEQLVRQLSEHRLTKRARVWWSFGLASSILFAIFGCVVAVTSPIDAPLRVVWCSYTAGNIFVACFAAALLRRGRGEPRAFFWFGLVITTLALGCFVALLYRALASPGLDAALGAGFGEFCLLFDMILLLYGRVASAQLATREHLLRIELLILDSNRSA